MRLTALITLILPLAAQASFWDCAVAPSDGLMSEPKVSRLVHEPTEWCHCASRNSIMPSYYVGLYPQGPSQCPQWPAYPPDVYQASIKLLDDADTLATLGCPMSYPTTIYMARLKGGTQGLVFAPANDHMVIQHPQPDDEKRRATISHELMHHQTNAAVGLLPVGDKWYAEAGPVATQLLLNPGNNSHIFAWRPWPSQMSWGLGNSANPFGRYHLGMFLQYLENKHGFNLCQWLTTHGQTLGLATEYQVWETINAELGIAGRNLAGLRTIWGQFIAYWGTGGTEYTPSVAELPEPGITDYPPDPRPGIDYDLSGTAEGNIWKVSPSADGKLYIQWRRASRCGGHPDPTPYITISRKDGSLIWQIDASTEWDSQRIQTGGTAPVLVSVGSLEGNAYYPEMYLGHDGWIVGTLSDSYFFDPRDPWPHTDEDTSSPTFGQCVPGAPQ